MKSTRVPGLVMAGVVGLAGLGMGAVIGPAGAVAATSSATQAVGDRLTAIKEALAGLVKDGTLTQAQADKVATTLDSTMPERGFGGHGLRIGAGLDEVAGIIGITQDDLRTQLRSGKTLAEIAKSKGISQETLVTKLVAAAKTRLAAEVKAGRLTQARADAITADLTTRITRLVTSTPRMRGPGHHGDLRRGWGGGPDGGSGDTAPRVPSPSSSGSTSSSST